MVYDSIIESRVGFGWGQIKIYIISGLIWIADAAELMIVGFLNPVLEKEWHTTPTDQAFFGSTIFVAWALGTLACALIVDRIGRILPLKVASVMIFLTGLLSSQSQTYYQLILIRFILGFFIGMSCPIFTAILSEISPAENRGKRFVIMNTSFIAGELFAVLFAYMTLDTLTSGNWRMMILMSAMMGIFAVVTVLLWGYESPRFLLNLGRH